MKKIFLFLGLLAGISAKAQLTEWVYGAVTAAPMEEIGTGLALRLNGSGQFLSGRSITNPTTLQLVKGNLPGTTTSPGFNKLYRVQTLGGAAVFIESSRVAEQPGSFAVAGDYRDPVTLKNYIYYVNVDGGGVPAATVFYNPGIPSASMRLGNIYSDYNNNFYLTGTILYDGGPSDLFVMKINLIGTILWSGIYDIPATSGSRNEAGYDLTLDAGGNNLAVVGSVSTNGAPADGFFLFVNANTGATVGQAQFWGTANSTDELHSITLTSGGNYLVTGKSNATTSGDYDMWGMKLFGIGTAATWNRIYQYNGTVNPNNDGVDAVENPITTDDYYLIGTTDNGVLGQKDMYTIHTDGGGKVVGLGQYTYGGTQDDVSASIDLIASSAVAGEVYMFGTTQSFGILTPDKLYYLKTDLNGQISPTCNIDRRDGRFTNGPAFISSNDFSQLFPLYSEVAFCVEDELGVGLEICNNTLQTKLEGMDLQTQGSTISEQALLISPNPVEQGASNIQLNVNAPVGTLEVIIADYMGRQYVNQRFDIRDGGTQTLSVELSKANLAPGIYLLRVNGLDKPASQVLIVK